MTVYEVVVGDLCEQDTDAVVNAANSSLLGGGGVDGALLAAGGADQLAARKALRAGNWPDGLPEGHADWTIAGGSLPAKWVIHTVGPQFTGKAEDAATLRSCYIESLRVAEEIGARSIAFPPIGTGAYGYPIRLAAAEVAEALSATSTTLDLVRLVVVADNQRQILRDALTARGIG